MDNKTSIVIMEQSKEYYAFISYKREDEKWAKWLQHKLEHYKFPTNLNGRTDLPKNIRPTFRDVTDLKPGLLAEEINNALLNSEWLIVACSPRAAKSPWVCKEAQTFIDLGRADHIIPFVIEGNPFSNDTATECYPEALLNLTGSKELLAANINEMGRDAAAIKVVARMFNLRFDTLWQRHEREQKRKRWMWIGGTLVFALASLGIGGYIAKQNIELDKANKEIRAEKNRADTERYRAEKANLSLQIANDSITQQNTLILRQRNDLIIERNNVLNANREIMEQNRVIKNKNEQLYDYISKLKEANNTYSKLQRDSKPYVIAGKLRGKLHDGSRIMCVDYHPYEPIVAFSDDWGVWLHYLNTDVEISLPTDEYADAIFEVRGVHFSTDGTELMGQGVTGVYVWNVESLELTNHFQNDDSAHINSPVFRNNFPQCFNADRFTNMEKMDIGLLRDNGYEFKNGRLSIIDKESNKKVCNTELDIDEDSILITLRNPIYNEILFVTHKKAALYDETKKAFILFFKGYNSCFCEFSRCGDYLQIGTDVFARTTIPIDTIQHLKYTSYHIKDFPKLPKDINYRYDIATKASLDIVDNTIIYKCGTFEKSIEVLRESTMGTAQEGLVDALFAGSNKIIAIVGGGRHRVYNIKTESLVGTFHSYVMDWDTDGTMMGHEWDLCNADSGIAAIKYINRKLYVLST